MICLQDKKHFKKHMAYVHLKRTPSPHVNSILSVKFPSVIFDSKVFNEVGLMCELDNKKFCCVAFLFSCFFFFPNIIFLVFNTHETAVFQSCKKNVCSRTQ